MIPTGIPLGRKPPEHGAGALLCLEGSNLRSSIACSGSKYPFGMSPCLCLVFFVLGKTTSFPHGFRREWIWDLSWCFSVWEADFLSVGFEIPAGSTESLAQPRTFFLPFPPNSLSFGAALKGVNPWMWRVASSVL